MEKIFEKSYQKFARVPLEFKRYLGNKIDWNLREFSKTEVNDLLNNASVSRKKNHINIVLSNLQNSNYNKIPKEKSTSL